MPSSHYSDAPFALVLSGTYLPGRPLCWPPRLSLLPSLHWPCLRLICPAYHFAAQCAILRCPARVGRSCHFFDRQATWLPISPYLAAQFALVVFHTDWPLIPHCYPGILNVMYCSPWPCLILLCPPGHFAGQSPYVAAQLALAVSTTDLPASWLRPV